jgi:hypothetical protein
MPDEIKKEIVNKKKVKKSVKRFNSLALWLILCILIIASGVALFFNLRASGYLDKFFPVDNNFYLVYLNLGNGNSTYYGQGLKKCGDYLILENPFFFRPTTEEETGDTILNLEKLQDSFYKPLSEMKIMKHSVIFIQQLQSDSPVIKEYENIK